MTIRFLINDTFYTMNYLLFVCLLMLPVSGVAQETQVLTPVESVDGIVNELLDLISIEKGEKIDTAAVRNLFLPSAMLTVSSRYNSNDVESVSLDEFLLLLTDPYYERGYLEKEIDKTVDTFNGIAQVFQSFYAKDSEGVEERGITSYQLVYSQNRWWLVSLLWTGESDATKLPKKYGGK